MVYCIRYRCFDPVIDPETQQPVGCNERNEAPGTEPFESFWLHTALISVDCETIANLDCEGAKMNNFTRTIPCLYRLTSLRTWGREVEAESCSSGKEWRTALGLSVFLGWLGLDRFYLGYPALGLFKMCSLGFFFIFHLVDILLIALQVGLQTFQLD